MRIPVFIKRDLHSNVYKDEIRIPKFTKIGPVFLRLEG